MLGLRYEPTRVMDLSKIIFEELKRKKKIIIGRPGKVHCDIELQDLSVSRPHCQLEWISDDEVHVTDLHSKNHTYINGEPLKGSSATIKLTDVLVIGNQVITLKKDQSNNTLALSAVNIAKQFSNGYLGLSPCTVEIGEGSFIAIMGPSGCGKSTLLKVLTGADPATQGKIEVFGIDLYRNYAQIKEMIGLVPQDDIVHKELTVEKALYYTYHLRARGEVDDQIMEQKISKVLSQLKLGHELRKSRIADLSGGQRKRVSIAIELLTEPKILFLDEPTSPLDPETIDEFMKCLQELTKIGTTVVMVTHKPEDINYVDQVIWLAKGGLFVYQGKAEKYTSYFGLESAVTVYKELYDSEKADLWYKRWNEGKVYGEKAASQIESYSDDGFSAIKQYKWLTARYLETKWNDSGYMFLILAQAPVIAILIGLIFDKFTLSVLFLMNLTALWLGSSNAAREIVSEMPIYQRERMYNLRLLPYLASKLTVQTGFAFVQVLTFVSVLFLFYSGNEVGLVNFFNTVLLLTFVALSAVIIGLFLSSLVKNSEQAIAMLPLLLIPQIIFSGVIYPIDQNTFIEAMSCLSLGRNGTSTLCNIQQEIEHLMPVCQGIPDMVYTATPSVKALALPKTFGLNPESFKQQFILMNAINITVVGAILMALKNKDRL